MYVRTTSILRLGWDTLGQIAVLKRPSNQGGMRSALHDVVGLGLMANPGLPQLCGLADCSRAVHVMRQHGGISAAWVAACGMHGSVFEIYTPWRLDCLRLHEFAEDLGCLLLLCWFQRHCGDHSRLEPAAKSW
jgi:hypothetical protein